MTAPTTVDELFDLYATRGANNYGEGVSLISHSLQCATLADRDGACDELIAAALLHDVGHLIVDVQNTEGFDPTRVDDQHELVGARLLAPLFGPRISQPVALHVVAKRWRCTVEPKYHELLSPMSQMTLTSQGGLLTSEERHRFESQPGFSDALFLREWDDDAKAEDMATPTFESFRPLLDGLRQSYDATRSTKRRDQVSDTA